ncbi:contractile injection system protein, VgrG/Pvc8 family [Pseudoalteromonas fenneropenaei]|uniref:Contractile injection system protein, VgrG/Pvc8 family n=1 Tax=Pseudoalteromonas fenneropenaei TaxID=1737459 RepID=A0ABV7CHY1_9GAMM
MDKSIVNLWPDLNHFFVTKLLLEQKISGLYRAESSLYSEQKLNNSDFIGKTLTFEIIATDVTSSYVSLHVIAMRFLGKTWGQYHYELQFAPKLQSLQQQSQERIFIDTDIQSVLQMLAEEAGYAKEQIVFRLSNPLPSAIEFVQAFESHYELFYRLLCEHGLVYWFENQNGDEQLIISDSNLSSPYLPQGMLTAIAQDGLNHVLPQNFVGFSAGQSIAKWRTGNSSSVALLKEQNNQKASRVFFEPFNAPVAEQLNFSQAQQLAYESQAQQMSLRGNVANTFAGCSLSLDSRLDSASGDYLILESRIAIAQPFEQLAQGGQVKVQCDVTLVPRSNPLRLKCPPHRAKPLVFPAKIESIGALPYLDHAGQYRVRRHFSQAAAPVACASQALKKLALYACSEQPQATGWHFPLTPESEVLIGCINNDPNHSFILGVTSNALQPSVVNANNATQNRLLSASQNELRFDDDPQKPYVLLQTLAGKHSLRLDARSTGRQFISWISQMGGLSLIAGKDLLVASKTKAITQLAGQDQTYAAKQTLTLNAKEQQHWQSGNQLALTAASISTQTKAGLNVKGGRSVNLQAEEAFALSSATAITLTAPEGASVIYGDQSIQIKGKGSGTLTLHSNGGEISLDNSGNVSLIATDVLTLKGRLITLDAPVEYQLEDPLTASAPQALSAPTQSAPASLAISAAGDADLSQGVIELAYQYQDGSPVQNAPYEVRLHDGTVLTGQLDQNGQARLENVPPGQFSVVYGEDSRPYQPQDSSTPNPLFGTITAKDARTMVEAEQPEQLQAAQSLASQAGEWLWGTLQGDFNANPSTSQIVTGTIISMIPVVDQIMDVRDIMANVMLLTDNDDSNDNDAWIAFTLTGIGLIPLFGSAIKGVGKVVIKNPAAGLDAAIAVMRKLGKGDPVAYLRTVNWHDLGKQAAGEVSDKINGLRDALKEISDSFILRHTLPDEALAGMQTTLRQLDEIPLKITQGMQRAAQQIGQKVNKALDDYQGIKPSSGVVGQPHQSVAKQLDAPKGNELPGASKETKGLDSRNKELDISSSLGDLSLAPNYTNLVSKFKGISSEEILDFYAKMDNLGIDYKSLIERSINKYKMTADEAHAVFGYTTKLFYRDLNHILANGGSREAIELTNLIKSGLGKMPDAKNMQYRGIRLDSNQSIEAFDKRFRLNNTIESSFWSTAPNINDSYIGSRNLTILTNSSKDISELAFGVNFHNKVGKPVYSSETIIPPGIKFKVIGFEDNGRVILREIP